MDLTRRLTRPATVEQTRPYMTALAHALDALGVGQGEEFVVAKADAEIAIEESIARARADDPSTSQRAALDALPRVGSQRRAAYEAIRAAGDRGMTYDEVEEATGISGVWKRISELKQGGWVTVAGERLIPATGSHGDVYVATSKTEGGQQPDFAPEQAAMFDEPPPQSRSRYHDPE